MKRTAPISAWHPQQLTVTDDLFLDHLSSNAYLVVNKSLLSMLGPNQAILLSNLVDKYKYFRDRGMLIDGHWFYLTKSKQMEQTGLSDHFWEKSREQLEELGVIRTKRKGMPAKLHFKIDTNKFMEVLQTCLERSSKLALSDHGINISINTNNKENKEKENRYYVEEEEEEAALLPYGINEGTPWDGKRPIDYQSFVKEFNEINDAHCRMTPGKKSDIQKQVQVFSGREISQALKNRRKVLHDSQYLTSWESIFTPKVERMEKYLDLNPPKPTKNTSGHKEKNYEYKDPDMEL